MHKCVDIIVRIGTRNLIALVWFERERQERLIGPLLLLFAFLVPHLDTYVSLAPAERCAQANQLTPK